ncbi:MAG: tRNA (5-methylaminomethyl-2-thiouridine)(34)-methyltransferase MnmD [Crocinitomicaceae bacterium]|nr:tRNA (5-methylaminomethyl-2-thiouridine)(34)-methyltransferase MnmD [Crocinitomicaceae bacterium]
MTLKNQKVKLTRDGSHTVFSEQFKETYHSIHGAFQEAKHVFIKHGVLAFLEKELDEINILEVGFGTGLNALLTYDIADKKKQKIKYTSLEPFPLFFEHISSLNYFSFFKCPEEKKTHFECLHTTSWECFHQFSSFFSFQKKKITIEKYEEDNLTFELIFFDAFSPTTHPEIWNINVLKKAFNLLKIDGLLVTYCAKGGFKRNLKSIGFEVISAPGPPGKREMTIARKIN